MELPECTPRNLSDESRQGQSDPVDPDLLLEQGRELTPEDMNAIALEYMSQMRAKEAEDMFQRAVDGYATTTEKTLMFDAVNNLGTLYMNEGQLDKAETMFRRALDGLEKAAGHSDPLTLRALEDLALLDVQRGQLKDAESKYLQALHGHEKGQGPEDSFTLHTVTTLGNLYMRQGRTGDAEDMYVRAVGGYEKSLGSEHQQARIAMTVLGRFYANQGRLQDAELMYQRATRGYEEASAAPGPFSPGTYSEALECYGSLCAHLGRKDEAARLRNEAFKAMGNEKIPGIRAAGDKMKAACLASQEQSMPKEASSTTDDTARDA